MYLSLGDASDAFEHEDESVNAKLFQKWKRLAGVSCEAAEAPRD
jgi:hypothetical protein